MDSLSILPLLPGDVPALAPILRAAFDDDTRMHTELEHDGPCGYDDGSMLLRMLNRPELLCRKVLLSGQPAGGFVVRPQQCRCTLELLFVDPALKNRGLGFEIWQQIEQSFPQARQWLVETPDYSTRNHHFYTKKCGFSFVKTVDYPNGGRSFLFCKSR